MLKDLLQDESNKSKNSKLVYRLVHRYGPITKAELIKQSGIKQTTMVRILDDLLNAKLVQINGYEESSGGRPPAIYEINPNMNYIVGIDLSRTHTKIRLVDLLLNKIDESIFLMTKEHTPEHTINEIIHEIHTMLQRNQIMSNDLLGIGVGAVGPLEREKGLILEPKSFLAKGWHHVPIVKQLEDAFSVKVMLENGANTAALGEYYQNTIPNQNILYCISGMGLRCGIVTNGQFVQNNTGDASSFGEMIIHVNEDTNLEDDKRDRLLSSYISLDSLLDEVKLRVKSGERSLFLSMTEGGLETSTIDHLFLGLRNDDSLIKEVIMKSAYYYGIGLANMVNILHPERVILSGPLIYDSKEYYERVIDTAKKYIFNYDKVGVSFSKGYLKENAVSAGAAVLIFESFFEN